MPRMKKKVVITAGVAVLVAAAASGVAMATSDDGEGKMAGPDADAATEAALTATGGGHANAVELDSEHGATWEVEVTKPDGVTVDVYLDDQLLVIQIDGDQERSDE